MRDGEGKEGQGENGIVLPGIVGRSGAGGLECPVAEMRDGVAMVWSLAIMKNGGNGSHDAFQMGAGE